MEEVGCGAGVLGDEDATADAAVLLLLADAFGAGDGV